MKTTKLITVILATFFGHGAVHSQDADSLGVIGDNLDLYAVLDAFKNSESIEAFEKSINDPAKKINNLDLNEDGEVDYIQVHDEGEDDAHAFVLRIDMGEGEDETQDVAVIELEKSGASEATVQIVGDVEIYGEDYIVEPKQDEGITERLMITNFVIVNVWGWPSVRFVFAPGYVRWHSPWRWGNYPHWWKPWKPWRWGVYHGFHAHHHHHYHVVRVHRCHRAHKHFVAHRRTSVKIKHHHHHHGHHAHGHKSNNNGVNKGAPNKNKTHQPEGGNKNQKKGYDSSRRSRGGHASNKGGGNTPSKRR